MENPYPPDDNSYAAKHVNKRKRTAHACEACRQRKSRCDRSRPMCELCREQGINCFYRDAAKMSVAATDGQSLFRLESRLADLENLLRTFTSTCGRGTALSPPSSSRNDRGDESFPTSSCSFTVRDTASFEMAPNAERTPGSITSCDSVDGMASITFADEAFSGFFGPTSNSSLLEAIVRAQSELVGQRENLPSVTREFSRPASPPTHQLQNAALGRHVVNPHALPPHPRILQLIDIFFENTGKFFPYLYKPHILRDLANMQMAGFKNVERSQLCILNLVLAFASTHCPSQEPATVKQDNGEVFLQMGLQLIPRIERAANNLQSVQALILATQYIQGTQRSSQTWDTLGNLVHAAFRSGLFHKTAQGSYTPLEAELRLRAWWMCFIMDKMGSMTYGRLPLIPSAYMTANLPANVELELLADGLPQDSSCQDSHGSILTPTLFLHTSKLYVILGGVIDKVYENNIGGHLDDTTFHNVLTRVLGVEQDLSKWTQELPQALAPISVSELDQTSGVEHVETRRFRTILTLRLLNVRMLLHRIVLSHLLEAQRPDQDTTAQDFTVKMSIGSLDTCVEAAVETIAIITRTIGQQYLLPIWWYSTYFVFSSSLVIYGTVLLMDKSSVRPSRYSAHALIQSLETALDVLGRIGDTRQVLRCQKIVGHLLRAAWALCPRLRAPAQGEEDRPLSEGGTRQQCEEAGPLPPEAGFDLMGGTFMTGLDPNLVMDLSSFTDDMTLFLSDGVLM